jgi:lipoate-protein ligase A
VVEDELEGSCIFYPFFKRKKEVVVESYKDLSGVYLSHSRHPTENLSLEEYLFDNFNGQGPLLFFYINHPTVIIGKNQNPWLECYAAAIDSAAHQQQTFYRRSSGGGTVYHDIGNINFSLIAGRETPDALLDEFVVQFLNSMGLSPTVTSMHDILLEGAKVSGRARCYRAQKALFHGTLLVNADLVKLRQKLAPGVLSPVTNRAIPSRRAPVTTLAAHGVKERAPLLMEKMAQRALAHFLQREELHRILSPRHQFPLAGYESRHESWSWRYGRTPSFSFVQHHPRHNGLYCEVHIGEGRVDAVRGPWEERVQYWRHYQKLPFEPGIQIKQEAFSICLPSSQERMKKQHGCEAISAEINECG